MENSESSKEPKPFQYPAWMLEWAQGAKPETMSRLMEKEKYNVKNNTPENQENRRVGAVAMDKAGGGRDINPIKSAEQAEQAPTPVITPKPISRSKAKAEVGKPEETGSKKEKVRSQPMNRRQEKLNDVTRPVLAESSTAGASREAAAAAASKPDLMANDTARSQPEEKKEQDSDDHYSVLPLPKWQLSMTGNEFQYRAILKNRPQALGALEALKDCIARCEGAATKFPGTAVLEALYDNLRDHIHKAEIRLTVTKYIIRKANMLSPTSPTGLPKIFTSPSYPSDIKADAYQLYLRWYKEDFNQDLLRGIKSEKGNKDRTTDRLDEAYRHKYPNTSKYHGNGDLVLGQWWPTQLCAVRDGAHGTPQGGIWGEKERGAFSIVLSGGHPYRDADYGDVIEYSGTEGKNSTPTENTRHLMTSARTGLPVRVIRSAQLAKGNKYRPEMGLRYDGLYRVVSYQETDKEKAVYRFRLERCAGQAAIRCQGKASRPTSFECEEFIRLKADGKWE
ncbi:hypothetical protein BDW02DRAFT_510144 [Decorospora gaudefroyi]|uniref:YDG domain-containing protein n=1 Tax=Decorospora gaudefroyi TaxID=184978 RepID=A0A6A5JX55_9PLEO|nr:hypothetical protein BDW02DRAFT_510144 [Decorospora gaudefroyi]